MDFIIDTAGNTDISDDNITESTEFTIDTIGNADKYDSESKDLDSTDFHIDKKGSSCKAANPFLEELFKDFEHVLETPKRPEQKTESRNPLVTEILADLGVNEDGTLKKRNIKPKKKLIKEKDKIDVKKILEKSIITPDFEKLHVVPPIDISDKKLKQQRRKERDLTKGSKWYGLPATELTDEVKRDLEVLQMRSVLDPKHFYKKNDLKVLPKYFQIGKVMDAPLDFYNDRVPKKQRKKTLVDELLADAEFNKYNKRKYKEIIEEKQKTHYKAWRQAKRLKKKK
ncbi:unnamed protein product [Psylliodes chrysocephalus]|uniref:Fcf2 pre-rRNA processing C-terminal domain-containing protein n=1 Tax=Psylliodes chrysocephalus TaxID=3402493 RepID=A0A9P0D4C5_9CUCU|nr:unnamed protein product [Psylliodes chrysocephala]